MLSPEHVSQIAVLFSFTGVLLRFYKPSAVLQNDDPSVAAALC